MTLRAHGVSFRYPSGRHGIRGTSLECGPGEVVALLGPNGSGKSTLLRLLATDLRPDEGRLEILGRDAARPDPSLRSRIGWAPDEPVHVDALTGRENLELFLQLQGARRLERADPLRAFGLGEDANVRAGAYSFGMRRKLLLAEAVAADPELLLLDEPTVGLDPEGTEALGREVARAARRGATVVLATNEIAGAPAWADRILFFHRGRIIEDGSREELLRRVRGRTRITVELEGNVGAADLPPLEPLEGAGSVHVRPGRLVVESSRGSQPLPGLLRSLLDRAIAVRTVRIQEPDLSDVYRDLVGVELGPSPGEPEQAGNRAPEAVERSSSPLGRSSAERSW